MKWPASLIAACIAAASVVLPAAALETFPSSDPRSVVQTVIDLTDRHALPDWSDPAFATKLRPYLTKALLSAVKRGGDIAARKSINLYDGEFFTGSQGLAHAKLFSAEVTKIGGDAATVEAKIGTTDDPKGEPAVGGRVRFQLKRVDGVWRIDDFRNLEDYAKSEPSIKTLFSDPVRYAQ